MDLYTVMNFHIKKATNKPQKRFRDLSDEQKAQRRESQDRYRATEHGKRVIAEYMSNPDVIEKRKAYASEYYKKYQEKKNMLKIS